MSLTLPAEGGCQCGAIRYRLTGEPVFLTICHCSECKRQSGSAFGMSMRMRWSDVEVTGQPKRWVRPADSGATVTCAFCKTCGTRVWHEPSDAPDFVHIKPGTLDDFSTLAPKYESWTVRKSSWLHFDGIEASFEHMPPRPRERR